MAPGQEAPPDGGRIEHRKPSCQPRDRHVNAACTGPVAILKAELQSSGVPPPLPDGSCQRLRNATLCGMNRVRISTTVDASRLAHARQLVGKPDSQLLDRALDALVDEVERAHELTALEAQPYEADPQLAWAAPPGPGLAYEGAVPADVLELAERRRAGLGR